MAAPHYLERMVNMTTIIVNYNGSDAEVTTKTSLNDIEANLNGCGYCLVINSTSGQPVMITQRGIVFAYGTREESDDN